MNFPSPHAHEIKIKGLYVFIPRGEDDMQIYHMPIEYAATYYFKKTLPLYYNNVKYKVQEKWSFVRNYFRGEIVCTIEDDKLFILMTKQR